ncbi:hypothetical protein OG194_21030 [Streptomyces sp. NBC_01288]|uniref:hypothetical protein n=1 Tax=Streptomyces sp. NBC_01288 TaxID=2903814 RepID=UPI002E112DC8|nr:hypothetical protein OG194_21030 [Streptomyces sp. NBC_01288]
MAGQRLVLWSIRDFGIDVTPGTPAVVDLNHDALFKRYPALADAIGRGRVTSHSIVHWGAAGPIITFIVED